MRTDRDMYHEVAETLGDERFSFDITTIVEQLQKEFGTVSIKEIPNTQFWRIVRQNELD